MLYYRKLFPADLARIAAHFLALPPGDRCQRFRCAVSDEFIRNYCRTFRWSERTMIGAFRFDRLIGLAESLALTPGRAEIAVSVAASERRLGIGRELVRRAAARAAQRGATLAVLDYEPGDCSIPKLVSSLGGRLDQESAVAMIPLSAPPRSTELEELIEGVFAATAWMIASTPWPLRFPDAA
jgi:GNAT superfamily N-acetyltransferase